MKEKRVVGRNKKGALTDTSLQKAPPVAISRVMGFLVVVARKNKDEGVLHDVGEYFEITARYDGANPLYAHVEKCDWKIILTHEPLKCREERKDLLVFSFPTGTVFTAIEIIEEEAPWCSLPCLDGENAPAVMVWVVISFKNGGAMCKSPEKWGLAVRSQCLP